MNQNYLIPRIFVTIIAVFCAIINQKYGPFHLDKVTIIAIVIAVIPWLAFMLKSIEIPNVIKLELNELKKKVEKAVDTAEKAEGAAESATNMATYATVDSAYQTNMLDKQQQASKKTVISLASEYNKIRKQQRSGSERTRNMTSVVRRMIEVTKSYSETDLLDKLTSKDRGIRLFGYAFLNENPDCSFLDPLVKSVIDVEDKPFGQYWGLKAISKTVGVCEDNIISTSIIKSLEAFRETFGRGTDRAYELRRILKDMKNDDQND